MPRPLRDVKETSIERTNIIEDGSSISSRIKKELSFQLRARNDPVVFAEKILGVDLWPRQKFILQAYYGKLGSKQDYDFDLTKDEKRAIEEDDGTPYKTLVLVAGMRASKTTLAALIALYETYKMLTMKDPSDKYPIGKGSQIHIQNCATSEQQAKDTVFSVIKNKFDHCDYLQKQDTKVRYNEIIFHKPNVVLRSTHSNSSSLAGRTSKAVIFDELARFNESGKSSAEAVYNTLTRSVETFGKDGRIIVISSPITHDDLLMDLYYQSHEYEDMLGLKYATWQMNPYISRKDLNPQFDRNPEAARRDYGAKPAAAEEPFFKHPWKIQKVLKDTNNWANVPNGAVSVMAIDPAQTEDNFGLSLAHLEDENFISVDYVAKYEPIDGEVPVKRVTEDIMRICNDVKPYEVISDVSWWPELQSKIRKQGIPTTKNVVRKGEYEQLKQKIYSDQIEIPEDAGIVQELKHLELIRGGRKIDHTSGHSKDVADAVANCVQSLLSSGPGRDRWRKPVIMTMGE